MRVSNSLYLPIVMPVKKKKQKKSAGDSNPRLTAHDSSKKRVYEDDFIDAEFEDLLEGDDQDAAYGESGYRAIQHPRYMRKRIYVDYYV